MVNTDYQSLCFWGFVYMLRYAREVVWRVDRHCAIVVNEINARQRNHCACVLYACTQRSFSFAIRLKRWWMWMWKYSWSAVHVNDVAFLPCVLCESVWVPFSTCVCLYGWIGYLLILLTSWVFVRRSRRKYQQAWEKKEPRKFDYC